MNSKEKKIIGTSVSAALLCGALGVPTALDQIERALVVSHSRDKVASQVDFVRECSNIETGPCKPGTILREGNKIPILDADGIDYQCGEAVIHCQKFPAASSFRPSSEDYYCFVPLAYENSDIFSERCGG